MTDSLNKTKYVMLDLTKEELCYLIDIIGKQPLIDFELVDYLMSWVDMYDDGKVFTMKDYTKYCRKLNR